MSVTAPSELAAAYQRRFLPVREHRRRVWAILTRDFFQQWVPRDGSVLDLGCGWGEFINQIDARQRIAMDLNPASGERLDPAVQFVLHDCSQPWPLADGALDVVFTSNFFEHLPDKPALRATVTEAFRCLKPGGRIICLGPNIRYLAGAYWDFWDHFVPLTERSLTEVLELVGFRIERCDGRFLPYTMATGVQWPAIMVALYLRLPLLWRMAGKQFLVVAKKKI